MVIVARHAIGPHADHHATDDQGWDEQNTKCGSDPQRLAGGEHPWRQAQAGELA